MSGLAFQKLNGEGTTATAQLNQLQSIAQNILDLKNKLATPDLKAWYMLLFASTPVVPYYKTLEFYNAVDATAPVVLGKRIFGEIQMMAASQEVSGANNTYAGCYLHAKSAGNIVHSVLSGYHGNDILPMQSSHAIFFGVVDAFHHQKFGSTSIFNNAKAVIRGFVIPEAFDLATLENLPAETIGLPPAYVTVNNTKPAILRLDLVQIPDGVNYANNDYAGLNQFQIYYAEGGNFLTPNIDFTYKPTGGFTLTGFAPLLAGQTLIVIF